MREERLQDGTAAASSPNKAARICAQYSPTTAKIIELDRHPSGGSVSPSSDVYLIVLITEQGATVLQWEIQRLNPSLIDGCYAQLN